MRANGQTGFALSSLVTGISLLSALSVPIPKAAAAIELEQITDSAGVQAPHDGGGTFMTGQVIADFNGSGRLDLFLTSSSHVDPNRHNRLFINQGGGEFELATFNDQVAMQGHRVSGALAFDYDNDGWPDLLVLGLPGYRLFRNLEGEGFHDITDAAGLTYPGRGTSAAAADFTGNGYADLFIANFSYSGMPPGCDGSGGCNATDRLFINNGDGTFSDITAAALDQETLDRQGFIGVWTDHDNDGRLDLYVVNDRLDGNVLWRNDGPGCSSWCFTDISSESGAGIAAFSMGLAVGDYENNLAQDFYVSDAFTQHLLRNTAAGSGQTFDSVADAAGVNADVFGWGALFVDLNNDGWLDLHLNTESSFIDPDPALCNRIFRNDRDGSFTDVSASVGGSLCGANYGIATGDLTGNGLQDLVIGTSGRQYRVLQNISASGNFLRIRPIGAQGVSRDAAGTRVWVETTDGQWLMRELLNGIGLGGGSEPILHFGLGDAEVRDVFIRWPGNYRYRIGPLAVNQTHEIIYDGALFIDGLEDTFWSRVLKSKPD